MNLKKFRKGIVLGVALLALCTLSLPAVRQADAKVKPKKEDKKVTHAQRKAAAALSSKRAP